MLCHNWRSMNSFLRDLIRVGMSNINIMVFGIGTSILTGRLLSPSDNGLISALLVYPSLFMVFGSLGIRQSTTYFVGKGIYELSKIRRAITQIWVFTTIICMIICYLLIKAFTKSIHDEKLIWVAIAAIPFSLYNTYSSGIYLGKNEIKQFNKINWIPNFITFLFTIILIYFFKLEVLGAILAILCGHVAIFSILIFKNDFLSHFSLTIEKEIIRKMLSLGIIYALSLLISMLNYKIDVILLENLSTTYQLGIYSKGTSIVQYLWQIPALFSTIIFARSAVSKDDLSFSVKVCQLLRLSLIVISILAFILIIFSKYVILILFGEAFLDSVIVMQILLPGVVLLTVFKVMNMDLAGKGKPWIAMQSMSIPLVFNVLLNFYLIPKYGSKGAALSSLITYSMAAFFFLHFYSKETKIKIKEILHFRKSDFDPIVAIYKKIKK